MNHLNEEQLVLHYYGELTDSGVEKHLAECPGCRAEYRAVQQVLNTVDTAPIPERAADYGEAVWRRIEGRLGARRRGWFRRSWWALAPAAAPGAALIVVARSVVVVVTVGGVGRGGVRVGRAVRTVGSTAPGPPAAGP